MRALLRYEQAPPFLQGNPHIRTGYRSSLDNTGCWRSLWQWHNETLNIWTHFAGTILALGTLVYDNTVRFPSLEAENPDRGYGDRLVVSVFVLCALFCMGTSTLFHMFSCQSHATCTLWLRRDFFGIACAILGCYIPGLSFAFECYSPVLRVSYTAIVAVLFLACLGMQNDRFCSPEWMFHRTMIYVAVVAFSLIPCAHWLTLLPPERAAEAGVFIPRLLCSYTLIGVGVVFYLTKFPESKFPGKFDIFGSSHQWWHVFVLVGFASWYRAGIIMVYFRLENPCSSIRADL